MATDPTSGFFFPGKENLHDDIYPSITASSTPSLRQPGKAILITGAGRGIGRAIALQYAHAGVAAIILCARTGGELDEVERSIAKIKPEIRVQTCTVDVTSEVAVQELAEKVQRDEGRLDVLVNNAGVSEPWAPLASSTPSDWWKTFEVNLKGPFLFVHAFLPLLIATAEKQKTTVDIVNMSSIGAHVVSSLGSAYKTSKLALCRLTEFVNVEYADKGVNAVGLHPGGVPTSLASDIDAIKDFLKDTPDLCGGFVVWLTAGARTWLAGRYVSATWDVGVLEGMREEIVKGDKLKVKLVI